MDALLQHQDDIISDVVIDLTTSHDPTNPAVLRKNQNGSSGQGHIAMAEFYQASWEWPTPEHKLMAAVLEDAVNKRDLGWINREDRPGYENLYSFRFVCSYLGLHCEAARKALNDKINTTPPGRKQVVFERVVEDPTRVYTHKYRECKRPSRCSECRQRYNMTYNELRRDYRRVRVADGGCYE